MSRSTADVPKPGLSNYVLDSFALIAWLRDEAGASIVQSLLEKAKENRTQIYVSWMNIAEFYYITKRRSAEADPRLAADRVVEIIENLPVMRANPPPDVAHRTNAGVGR